MALPLAIAVAVVVLAGGGVAVAASPRAHARAATVPRQASGGTVNGGTVNGSSGSVSTVAPQLTYTISSRHRRNRAGWYRSPVTIRFRCHTAGATLVGPCPKRLTVRRNGRRIQIKRAIHTTDGGSDAIVVTLKIDRTRPRVWAAGVVNGRLYRRAPRLRCRARDRISGIRSCRVFRRVVISGDLSGRDVHYRVVATNRAGSHASRRGSYRLAGI